MAAIFLPSTVETDDHLLDWVVSTEQLPLNFIAVRLKWFRIEHTIMWESNGRRNLGCILV